MPMNPTRMEEIVATLNGSRARGAGGKAAVLVDDLSSITRLATKLRSKVAAGAPTKAEYDALQADVEAIHRCLMAIAEIIKTKTAT